MDYDTDKVDDLTLALLYLVVSDHKEGLGARAWKGFDPPSPASPAILLQG